MLSFDTGKPAADASGSDWLMVPLQDVISEMPAIAAAIIPNVDSPGLFIIKGLEIFYANEILFSNGMAN